MTQQPYYPPAPQQGYPPQQSPPQQYAPPPPQYPQAPPAQYPAQQGYAPQPQQPPAQPLAQGTIDDYYSQPSVGGGPSISWSNPDKSQKPLGTSYAGIVARDVTNADVQQQTDFNTKAPLFYKDGRPKFAMKVPLKVQQSPEFPDGEAVWYVKGQGRDELVRAMAEAGCDGAPKGGAALQVTLVQRRQSGAGLNPSNVVQVRYTPAAGQAQPAAQAPVQQQIAAPTDPASTVQYQQPVQQEIQYAQPVTQPPPAPQQFQAPPVQQQVPAPQVVQQPQAPAPAAPQPPSDLTPEQQALLSQLTGGQG